MLNHKQVSLQPPSPKMYLNCIKEPQKKCQSTLFGAVAAVPNRKKGKGRTDDIPIHSSIILVCHMPIFQHGPSTSAHSMTKILTGCIYALNKESEVLKINTNDNDDGNNTFSWAWVGNRVDTNYDQRGHAIAGIDGCVYWPPLAGANHTLQHDPHIDHTSLVGDVDLG